jgi:putative spermidine/putrescine transport system ATP-binding protein/putrescine transport system ATP-binding protein
MTPILELRQIEKRFGTVPVVHDMSFTVAPGEALCLLGPSGCGKTTTIRMIAGLEQPASGSIWIGGNDVTRAPPQARNIGLVFQDYALFPHMTVAENIAFGLRHRNAPKSAIAPRVQEALALVQLQNFAGRRPSQLSGGQQQRVAVARALATRPAVLLLDEPLSNLDAKLRTELRIQLRTMLREVGITSIMVTHDQEEAMGLADRIIVMNQGGIEQIGRPLDVYDAPATRFVAEFLGHSNWLAGQVGAAAGPALTEFRLQSGEIILAAAPDHPGAPGFDLCLRPERISVGAAGTLGGGNRNVLRGHVRQVEALGAHLHLHLGLATGEYLLASMTRNETLYVSGTEVDIAFRPQDIRLIPKTAGR